MSATWAKPSVRRRWRAAVGEKRRERVVALDAPLVEVAGAVGPEDDGAVLGRADEQPADVGVRAQGRDELGMARVDLLERQPAVDLHQVDQPEVAGAQDDDVALGDVVLRLGFSFVRPVASFTACWTIAFCSSPPAKPETRPRDSERSTSSSSP